MQQRRMAPTATTAHAVPLAASCGRQVLEIWDITNATLARLTALVLGRRRLVYGNHAYPRAGGAAPVALLAATELGMRHGGLIIRKRGRDARRRPRASAVKCLLLGRNRREAGAARFSWNLGLVDHPSTIDAGTPAASRAPRTTAWASRCVVFRSGRIVLRSLISLIQSRASFRSPRRGVDAWAGWRQPLRGWSLLRLR
jgi:hypothetical protein